MAFVVKISRVRTLNNIVSVPSVGLALTSLLLTCATPAAFASHKSSRGSSKSAHRRHDSDSDSTPRHHSALIKVSTAKLRSAPDGKSQTSALLDEGRSAKVIGRKAGWVKLRLDSGREGWVRHDLVDVSKSKSRDVASDSGHSSKHSSRHTRTEIADVSSSRHSSHSEHSSSRHSSGDSGSSHRAKQVVAIADHGSKAAHSAAPSHETHHSNVVVALADTHPKVVISVPDASEADTATTEPDGTVSFEDSNPKSERLVSRALSYRGTPYRMGATGNGAFDCSGFMQYLFSSEGTSLPRTAAEQYDHGRAIAKSDLQPGDLVFFKNTYKAGVSHVGLYIGNNSFVHASSGHGRGVTVSKLDEAYYTNHWAGARRPR